MVQTLLEGSGGSISISSGAWGSWPLGPEGTLGAGTWWCASCQGLKWALGSGTRKPLGPQDPRAPPGAGTRFGVRGSGWAPIARTQMPPDHVTLLRGLAPGTKIWLQGLPSMLEVTFVLATL
jgi:hypothetical protein